MMSPVDEVSATGPDSFVIRIFINIDQGVIIGQLAEQLSLGKFPLPRHRMRQERRPMAPFLFMH